MRSLNWRKVYPSYPAARAQRTVAATPSVESLEARRLLSGAGQIDSTYGFDGTVFDAGLPGALAMKVQTNGKFVEAGNFQGNFQVARFNANGLNDFHFATQGVVVTDFGGTDVPAKIAIQSDGKIIVAGTSNGDFAVARYNANGKLDTTFGAGGKIITRFGTPSTLTQLGVLGNGRIELYGHGQGQVGGNIYGQEEFVRYTKNGVLDSTFGSRGKLTIASPQPLFLGDAAILRDGEIISSITLSVGHQSEAELVRYNANGSVGTIFPNPFGANELSFRDQAGGVAVQSDGKILFSRYNVYDSVLIRYNANGTLDKKFGTGGVATMTGNPATNNLPPIFTSLYESSAGQIVATDGAAVYRYNSDGSVDNDFGFSGHTIAPFPAGGLPINIDAGLDDTIVIAGGLPLELDTARFGGG